MNFFFKHKTKFISFALGYSLHLHYFKVENFLGLFNNKNNEKNNFEYFQWGNGVY